MFLNGWTISEQFFELFQLLRIELCLEIGKVHKLGVNASYRQLLFTTRGQELVNTKL
ncbi:Uncharacterised protein [Vibrio cholerae]|uniref:Uncharacterized protein n=1 Tax=Vibrio cholerae TaxID=666 RepID=A0A655ZCF7_VIBCL|nr:Uncharacterised protein [Vibrio cholerae]